MLEMATVLVVIGILMIISYELSFAIQKRKLGEDSKSIF